MWQLLQLWLQQQMPSAQMGSSAARADANMQQQVATSILEPCDVTVSMKNKADLQDLTVDVSALQLRMSPDVMQLLMHLQQVG